MESYNIYKKGTSEPIYTAVVNSQYELEILKSEYGINDYPCNKRDEMPTDKNNHALSCGLYYYKSDIAVSKEGILLGKIERLHKKLNICAVAAWLFIICFIISVIYGIIIGVNASQSHNANNGYDEYASDTAIVDSAATDAPSIDDPSLDSSYVPQGGY